MIYGWQLTTRWATSLLYLYSDANKERTVPNYGHVFTSFFYCVRMRSLYPRVCIHILATNLCPSTGSNIVPYLGLTDGEDFTVLGHAATGAYYILVQHYQIQYSKYSKINKVVDN